MCILNPTMSLLVSKREEQTFRKGHEKADFVVAVLQER